VTEHGMSELFGRLSFKLNAYTNEVSFSPATAELVDKEVRRIVDTAGMITRKLLNKRTEEVRKVGYNTVNNLFSHFT
jgi:cell division protease FtsH